MALADWTGTNRWKVEPGVDYSQIPSGDMAADDLLTITEVGGVMDALMRKPAGTTTSSVWGTSCVNLAAKPNIVTFTHGGAFYLVYLPGTPGVKKNEIQCWRGRYSSKGGGGPTGAVWTAEDQT